MAKLQDIGEFGLIQRLEKTLLSVPSKKWSIGIGDDAAVRRLPAGNYELFTQDLLLEGVHFLSGDLTRWEQVGWKSLAVNLSDIAAMGGTPTGAVVGLGLPKTARLEEVEALYRGLAKASKKYACPIVGGDTNASKGGWVVSITVLGETKQAPLLRRSARNGDSLWVSGALGSAALGWKILQNGKTSPVDGPFLKRFLTPEPRLDWGSLLIKSGMAGACMDLSDGLAGDLAHLSKASRVGFEVELNALPRHPRFTKRCLALGLSEDALMVNGGEDYELLFTVRAGKQAMFKKYCSAHGWSPSLIGKVQGGSGIQWLKKGRKITADYAGFHHF